MPAAGEKNRAHWNAGLSPQARIGKQGAKVKRLKRELEEARLAADKAGEELLAAKEEARRAAAKMAKVQEELGPEEEQLKIQSEGMGMQPPTQLGQECPGRHLLQWPRNR